MSMVFFSVLSLGVFFFVKQTTAYEMRISDWSSDVCSSDLDKSLGSELPGVDVASLRTPRKRGGRPAGRDAAGPPRESGQAGEGQGLEIGRASCRERVLQYG